MQNPNPDREFGCSLGAKPAQWEASALLLEKSRQFVQRVPLPEARPKNLLRAKNSGISPSRRSANYLFDGRRFEAKNKACGLLDSLSNITSFASFAIQWSR